MIKLKKLRIDKFRHVQPGTELVFADGMNVVLGKNGTGKTTLLRLLEAVATSDFSAFASEEFKVSSEWADGDEKLALDVANEKRQLELVVPGVVGEQSQVEFVSSARVAVWLKMESGPLDATIMTKDGRTSTRIGDKTTDHPRPAQPTSKFFRARILTTLNQILSKSGDTVFNSPLALAWLTQQDRLRFDESLGTYDELKSREMLSSEDDEEKPNYRPFGYVGLPRNTDSPPKTLQFYASDLPFIRSAESALGVVRIELELTLVSKEADGRQRYGKVRFWITRADGSQHDDTVLSYGQKRLLSFLHYLAANDDIVIADELVNGLHHDWIDLCVEQIGQRQAFLTSQNPLLMDHVAFDSVDEVRRAFILCDVDLRDGVESQRWRNMNNDVARRVYEAAEIGIEHLSTILRNEGVW